MEELEDRATKSPPISRPDIILNSPAGHKAAVYKWPLTYKVNPFTTINGANEIIENIRWVAREYPEFKMAIENLFSPNESDVKDYDYVKSISDKYNKIVDHVIRIYRGTSLTPKRSPKANNELLKHILHQVYSRAVTEPHRLNEYEPFSSDVYGETPFEFVSQMIEELNLKEEDIFIDLGSGVGQVVLQMAAASPCKKCIGIERADAPSSFATMMDEEFKFWMEWHGKVHKDYELITGDFFDQKFKSLIKQSTCIFINNYSYEPEDNHRLKLRFIDLKEGTKIVSSRPFCPPRGRETERILNDIGSIMTVREILPRQSIRDMDSLNPWSDRPPAYYIHMIDASKLQEYNDNLRKQHEENSLVIKTTTSLSKKKSTTKRPSCESNTRPLCGATTRKAWSKWCSDAASPENRLHLNSDCQNSDSSPGNLLIEPKKKKRRSSPTHSTVSSKEGSDNDAHSSADEISHKKLDVVPPNITATPKIKVMLKSRRKVEKSGSQKRSKVSKKDQNEAIKKEKKQETKVEINESTSPIELRDKKSKTRESSKKESKDESQHGEEKSPKKSSVEIPKEKLVRKRASPVKPKRTSTSSIENTQANDEKSPSVETKTKKSRQPMRKPSDDLDIQADAPTKISVSRNRVKPEKKNRPLPSAKEKTEASHQSTETGSYDINAYLRDVQDKVSKFTSYMQTPAYRQSLTEQTNQENMHREALARKLGNIERELVSLQMRAASSIQQHCSELGIVGEDMSSALSLFVKMNCNLVKSAKIIMRQIQVLNDMSNEKLRSLQSTMTFDAPGMAQQPSPHPTTYWTNRMASFNLNSTVIESSCTQFGTSLSQFQSLRTSLPPNLTSSIPRVNVAQALSPGSNRLYSPLTLPMQLPVHMQTQLPMAMSMGMPMHMAMPMSIPLTTPNQEERSHSASPKKAFLQKLANSRGKGEIFDMTYSNLTSPSSIITVPSVSACSPALIMANQKSSKRSTKQSAVKKPRATSVPRTVRRKSSTQKSNPNEALDLSGKTATKDSAKSKTSNQPSISAQKKPVAPRSRKKANSGGPPIQSMQTSMPTNPPVLTNQPACATTNNREQPSNESSNSITSKTEEKFSSHSSHPNIDQSVVTNQAESTESSTISSDGVHTSVDTETLIKTSEVPRPPAVSEAKEAKPEQSNVAQKLIAQPTAT